MEDITRMILTLVATLPDLEKQDFFASLQARASSALPKEALLGIPEVVCQ